MISLYPSQQPFVCSTVPFKVLTAAQRVGKTTMLLEAARFTPEKKNILFASSQYGDRGFWDESRDDLLDLVEMGQEFKGGELMHPLRAVGFSETRETYLDFFKWANAIYIDEFPPWCMWDALVYELLRCKLDKTVAIAGTPCENLDVVRSILDLGLFERFTLSYAGIKLDDEAKAKLFGRLPEEDDEVS